MSEFTDADIKGNITRRLFLSAMKWIFHPDFGKQFDKLPSLFAELSKKQTGMEYIKTVLRYMHEVRDDIDPDEMETKLIRVMDEDKKEIIMTVAERLRKEGKIQGKIETYNELLADGFLSKEMVDQKLAELNRKLKEATVQNQPDMAH